MGGGVPCKLSIEKISALLVISIFFINLKLLPIDAEFQPILTLLLSLLIIVSIFDKQRFSKELLYKALYVFLFIVVLLLYFILSPSTSSLISMFKYLLGPFVYLTLVVSGVRFEINKFRIVFSIVTIYYLLWLIGPLSEFNQYLFGRGGGLPDAPFVREPSYFFYIIGFAAMLFERILFSNRPNLHAREIFLVRVLIIFMALFTGSLLNYLFVIVYFVYLLRLKYLLLGLIIISLFIVFYSFNLDGRVGILLKLISFELAFSDFLFVEPSGSTRLVLNYVAFSNMVENPFGSGLGSFKYSYQNFMQNNPVFYKHEVLGSLDVRTPQTYVASVFHDFGVFGFIFLLFLFRFDFKVQVNRYKLFLLTLLAIMVFFQSPLTNPVFWFTLYFFSEKL